MASAAAAAAQQAGSMNVPLLDLVVHDDTVPLTPPPPAGPSSSSSARLGPFRPLVRLLALDGAPEGGRGAARTAYVVAVRALVAWSLLGWCVRAAFDLAGRDMPDVPGWYEVSAATSQATPSGLTTTMLVVASYAFLARHFAGLHAADLPDLAARVERMGAAGPGGSSCAALRRYARWPVAWAVLCTAAARYANVAGAASDSAMLHAAWPLVALDWAVTLLSFGLQFLTFGLFWVYVSALCALHGRHVRAMAKWMGAHGVTASPGQVDRAYREVVGPAAATSDRWAGAAACHTLLLLAGTATVVVDLALDVGESSRRAGLYLRFIYVVAFGVPLVAGHWLAAGIASAADGLYLAAHSVPVCKTSGVCSEHHVFLNTYFMAAAASNRLSFRLVGTPLRREHLVRAAYVGVVLMASVLQYRLRPSASSS